MLLLSIDALIVLLVLHIQPDESCGRELCCCISCNAVLLMQEGLRTLLTRHGSSSATLDDVLLALLNGFAASAETSRSGSFFCLVSDRSGSVACHIMPICQAYQVELLSLDLLDTLHKQYKRYSGSLTCKCKCRCSEPAQNKQHLVHSSRH